MRYYREPLVKFLKRIALWNLKTFFNRRHNYLLLFVRASACLFKKIGNIIQSNQRLNNVCNWKILLQLVIICLQQDMIHFIRIPFLLNAITLFFPLQIVEKLVDIVTYTHQAILEAFGDNGMSNISQWDQQLILGYIGFNIYTCVVHNRFLHPASRNFMNNSKLFITQSITSLLIRCDID